MVQVAAGSLDGTGSTLMDVSPPCSLCQAAVNGRVYFQAFSIGSGLTLPGRLSNAAAVAYLP